MGAKNLDSRHGLHHVLCSSSVTRDHGLITHGDGGGANVALPCRAVSHSRRFAVAARNDSRRRDGSCGSSCRPGARTRPPCGDGWRP